MTPPPAIPIRSVEIPTVTDGQQVGDLKIAESVGRRLRLVSNDSSDRTIVIVGIAALAGFGVFIATSLRPAGAAPPAAPWMAVLGWLPLIGIACLCVGLPRVGRSFLFDGSAKTLTRRWLLLARQIPADKLENVYVKVFNEAGKEKMILGLARVASAKPIRLTTVSTAQRQAMLIAVARRIAELLAVPLVTAGKPVEASDEVRRAMEASVARGAVPVASPQLLINCPRCGARGVPGLPYDYVERHHGIAVMKTTWVKCTACQSQLYSKVRANELYGRSPDELAGVIVYRAPAALIRNFFAIAALVLGIFPMVGLAVAIPAVILNWRQARWAKIISLVGLVFAVLVTGMVTVFMLLDNRL